MLMRSMASVYSPRRSSGMTTSSLILKALVCFAIAAVLARSSQNLPARCGAHGDEALARAAIGEPHDFRGGGGDRRGVLADDVAEQDHLRQRAALGLGAIADRAQVALVEMLETREHARPRLAARVQIALDLDDRRNGFARLAEELQAHGANVLRSAVQNPARRRDDAVAAFLLHAGQAAQELVGDVLAEPGLAELRALDRAALACAESRPAPAASGRPSRRARSARPRRRGSCRGCGRGASPRASCRRGSTMRHQARLSTAVPQSTAFLPPAFMAMLPPMQQASAEVGSTANTRPLPLGQLADAARDHARLGEHRRRWLTSVPGKPGPFDGTQALELLGVDHGATRA